MGKKHRKNRRPHSVLRSLKDLSLDAPSSLARLATTVKGDMPTLMLGTSIGSGGGTVKNDGFGAFARPEAKPASKLSRFAQKFVPFGKAPVAVPKPVWSASHTAEKMKLLAHQMALGNPKMRVRRSRLPLVVALLALLVAGGGYYTYQNVSLPPLSRYLDLQGDLTAWLGTASGVKTASKKPTAPAGSKATATTATAAATPKASTPASFKKLSPAEKQAVWRAKLAALKKASDAKQTKYAKPASHKVVSKKKTAAEKRPAGKRPAKRSVKDAKTKSRR